MLLRNEFHLKDIEVKELISSLPRAVKEFKLRDIKELKNYVKILLSDPSKMVCTGDVPLYINDRKKDM